MSTPPRKEGTGLVESLPPFPPRVEGDPYSNEVIAELESLNLPSEDGEPLETNWHRVCMNLLIDSVFVHLSPRTDFFAGGNMFIYFDREHALNRNYRGPDFFFVDHVPFNPAREDWRVWREGSRFPDAIIELASPSTVNEDRTTKFGIYEQIFRTKDYFIYDPGPQTLEGWHLKDNRYEPLMPNEQGRLWCSSLGLWVGRWRGVRLNMDRIWLRFFDTDGNFVPLEGELERRRAQEQLRRAEEEKQRAEEEKRRAEEEKRRAEEEKQRADAAESELARLRALLAAHEKDTERAPPT